MKVLVVDMLGCNYPDLGYQIKTAFESIGHSVIPFDYRKYKLQHIGIANKLLNRMLVRTAVNNKVDLVLVNKGESILPGTIKTIRKAGIKTANWEPDEPFGVLQAFNKLQNIAEYDAFFIYDKNYVEQCKAVNPASYYLPPGADPYGVHKEHTPLSLRQYPADICLVGTAYPNRIQLLMPHANSPMRLAGPGWDKAPAPLASKSLPFVKIDRMVGLFNESKVVLNPYGAAKGFIVPNPRTFEIPASRSFQLTDAPRDTDEFLRPGKEIVLYHDEKEFNELLEYYIENDEARVAIAQAGYDRVIAEHTMVHRIKELLRVMKLG